MMTSTSLFSSEHQLMLETNASAIIGSFSDDSEGDETDTSSALSIGEENVDNVEIFPNHRKMEDSLLERKVKEQVEAGEWDVAPGKFGRRAESDAWSEEEKEVLDTVLSQLSTKAHAMFTNRNEIIDLMALRLVRGYWRYEPRVETLRQVFEDVTEWRLKWDVATILRSPLDCDHKGDFHRHVWPSWFLGRDRYGHPVILDRLQDLDWKRVFELPTEDLIRLRIQALECLQREAARHSANNPRVYKIVNIIDVSGATFSALSSSKVMEFAKQYAKLSEKMYADAAWTNLVINAPGIVRYTWRIIERIIDDETRDIVRFVPVGNAGIHALTQELPQSIIPRYLGGSGGNLELMLADFMDKDFTLDQSVRQVNEEARQGLDDDNEDDVEFVQDTNDLLSATWDLVNAEHCQQNTLRSRRHHVHHTKPENTNTIELDLIEDHPSIDHTHGNYRPRAASIDCTPPRSPDRIAVFALIRLVTDFLRIYEFSRVFLWPHSSLCFAIFSPVAIAESQ